MEYFDNSDDDDAPVGRILSRRELLCLVGATGIALTVGSNTAVRAATGEPIDLVALPEVTEGPFFVEEKLNRSVITDMTRPSVAHGIPLTLNLRVFDVRKGKGTPLTGAHVDIWHCDTEGVYSDEENSDESVQSTSGQKWLRGYQTSDSSGKVQFTTIYPGWYSGRITHIHFQVYLHDNLNVTATATSQLAFPQAITQAVYSSSLYSSHGQNSSVTSFTQDNVFSDGTTYQMLTVTGDVTNGYTASLVVGVSGS